LLPLPGDADGGAFSVRTIVSPGFAPSQERNDLPAGVEAAAKQD
jgi:hypothetical protein